MFRVYYLDDELELLEMFASLFSSEAVEVSIFSSPSQLIEAVSKNPPDLLFLDYRLPGTNGEKVALQLDTSIPKVLVTGDLDVEVSGIFLKVFHKPFDFSSLSSFIDGQMKTSKKSKKTA